ncbi:glycosyltransferase family 4 protein [soil metagenome]
MKVLILNYYWPPSGGSVVQRWLTFSRYLPENGITPVILTIDELSATYPATDRTLIDRIPKELKVYKTGSKELFWIYKKFIGKGKVPGAAFANESDPNFLQKISRFIRGNFFIPDPRIGWNKIALPEAITIIEKEKIDVIITSGPPHSTHLMGLKLKERLNIKWIADFHDVWTDIIYYDKFYKTSWAKSKDKALERKILKKSDAVLTVGKKYKETLLSKLSEPEPEKFHLVSMGYDNEIFDKMVSSPPQNEFIITYAGTIANFYEPEAFILALKKVKEQNPNVKLKLRFVGILAETIKKFILSSGLESILEETGYVSHHDSVKYLFNSSVLLLINPVVKNEDMVIPGKIYEYLAAKKPIINITKRTSDIARIIKEARAGETFERNMGNDLTEHLNLLIKRWNENKDLDLPKDNNYYRQFSRKEETKILAKVIKEL